jgi:hypothetical protein
MGGKKVLVFSNGLINQLTLASGFRTKSMVVALISGRTNEFLLVRVLMA